MIVRVCNMCKQAKPLSEFYNCKKYGKKLKCKMCWNAAKIQYRKDNADKLKILRSEYNKAKYHNDITWKLAANLRSRLVKTIKYGSAVRDLGCSIDTLKLYLESQFLKGMSWDNYGKWHIDHIIPLSSFNLKNPIEFKKACHFTNLQPLWAKDNMVKGSKIEYVQN